MSTYVVVFFPDATLNTAAVGPFRRAQVAEAARARLERALDPPETGDDEQWAWRRPQVVTCMSERDAVERCGITPDEGRAEA